MDMILALCLGLNSNQSLKGQFSQVSGLSSPSDNKRRPWIKYCLYDPHFLTSVGGINEDSNYTQAVLLGGIGPLIDSGSAGTKGAELVVLTGKRTKNLALISSADYECLWDLLILAAKRCVG